MKRTHPRIAAYGVLRIFLEIERAVPILLEINVA
jgi:hypothetical protein